MDELILINVNFLRIFCLNIKLAGVKKKGEGGGDTTFITPVNLKFEIQYIYTNIFYLIVYSIL